MRVLVVEDSVLIALMIENSVLSSGHEVVGPAFTGAAAMDLISDKRIDLALVDIDLESPGLGIDIVRHLDTVHGIKCVFVSAQLKKARANSQHVIGILQKPFSAAAVQAVLKYAESGTLPPKRPDALMEFTVL
tara:strand:+ start:599 stop:997 length:399 start_codon:yes stop_codon:yes gene_type:complete